MYNRRYLHKNRKGIVFLAANSRETGSGYEKLAAGFLEKKGLRILRYNFRCRSGEIDLIATDGVYLIFVEVKYRKDPGSGSSFSAVGRAKQKKISRVAVYYLMKYHKSTDIPCRFDVVGIDGNKIHWIQNAFDYCE